MSDVWIALGLIAAWVSGWATARGAARHSLRSAGGETSPVSVGVRVDEREPLEPSEHEWVPDRSIAYGSGDVVDASYCKRCDAVYRKSVAPSAPDLGLYVGSKRIGDLSAGPCPAVPVTTEHKETK